MSTVGVVGLGAMGSRIAGRLLVAGHDVIVWNRTGARVEPLIERGAMPAESPADVAGQAEAVITMVTDHHALRDVTEGPEGVFAGAATTIIQMSTVSPDAVARMSSVLPKGTELLDAPVCGSVLEADLGSLTILLGGSEELVERWRPLLSAMGSPIFIGPLGAGTRGKLVANAALFGVLGVLGEALALGNAFGLSKDTVFDILALTPLASQAERRRASVETGRYPSRFALPLARKDADLILKAAEAAGADLRIGKAMRSWLAEAQHAGHRRSDYTGVLAHILDSGHQQKDSPTGHLDDRG